MAAIFSWLYNWFSNLFAGKKGKILFLGLDNAGKTTLLHLLKTGNIKSCIPTLFAQNEEVTVANVTINAFDIGGHASARIVWKTYFADCSGLVYLVDASDEKRLAESKTELQRLLAEPALQRTPIAIVGNKIDVRTAVSETQLREYLGITDACTGKAKPSSYKAGESPRPIETFMCSVVRKAGYVEPFQWLARYF